MQEGKDIIVQGYLTLAPFAGSSDFLVKVKGPSNLGDYHYEVWDTKLSKKLKPYFAIQLCCYSEMVAEIQGVMPKKIAVVLGNNKIEHLNIDNYFAYYKTLKNAFLTFHQDEQPTLPDPAESRNYGRWSNVAKKQLEIRDHLSQVAGLSRGQIKNLEKAGICTMQELAQSDLAHISNMSPAIFQQNKQQTQLQIASRGLDVPEYKALPHDPGKKRGLAMLPPHSGKDVFFDIEGCPDDEGGLEYLWGNTYFDDSGQRTFIDFWAHDYTQEKQCFSDFINWVYDRWLDDPTMHVYHYANYEIAAIRKLMGRHGVCEDMVDTLLRNEVFVDLYNVVRHGIMIGTPSYSIKYVEHIYRGKRNTDVKDGGESIIVYENWRDDPDGDTWQTSEILNSIRDYNIDDCDSTQELTEWLRTEQTIHDIGFVPVEYSEEEKVREEINQTTLLRDKILLNAADIKEDDLKQSTLLETLAWSLEFHRRENKPTWWRYFDRKGLTEIELYDDMDCLVGLTRTSKEPYLPTERARNMVYEYCYDNNQPFKGKAKSFYVHDEDDLKLTTNYHEPDQGIIALQSKEPPPARLNLIPDEFVNPNPIPIALKEEVEECLDNDFKPRAITDFLRRTRPRIKGNNEGPIIKSNGDLLQNIISASINLENSYLCIQGPPGAGKTYTAKHIIGELLKSGKKVGISSNSHKAIINLMDGVADHVNENKIKATLIKVGGSKEDPIFAKNNVKFAQNTKPLTFEEGHCVGGTAWAFSNEKCENKFDYLFVDEAGQVSVANLIGMSRSCNNIILMGDQMQLGQPIQGSHPGESGMSILEYLLEGQAIIPKDLGIFLPNTYRMHPDLCAVISKLVYEGQLSSAETASKHVLKIESNLIKQNSGVCFVPVEHEGNTHGSEEEVTKIKEIALDLIGTEYWLDDNGVEQNITWDDILFVAPYNFQVNKLRSVLGDEAKIGSVDKFQGQEAPIVILSMCSSDATESPRGIEFLFSKNRLNVALSRAQALAVVVGSPRLGNTSVNNLKQMELINFYCEITLGNKN